MKELIFILIILIGNMAYAQQDSVQTYKKRVLENVEVDILSSYYHQNGDNASVTGGIGSERLSDVTPTIVVSIPIKADAILSIDAGISAYTSASSSNLDPFDASGASRGMGDDDDDFEGDDEDDFGGGTGAISGNPWVASSGASKSDVWSNVHVNYMHYSDDRNKIWSANASFSSEYDYISTGFGGSFSRLFNDKNTEIGLSAQVYLDQWNPKYPTELDSYLEAGKNLQQGFFNGIDILNENGQIIDKNGLGSAVWNPSSFSLIENKSRNSYSMSFSWSQIINRNSQFSLFLDLVQQTGWLSNPMQRVYFADRNNFYIGNAAYIPQYTSAENNKGVFRLADDIERLPDQRFKVPIGMRLNYYINESMVLKTYYRYYIDNWGLEAHTAYFEIPLKLISRFTFYPSYRFYTQKAADYFAPFEQHISTETYYTSDFDLSAFRSHQYGFAINYTDIFTNWHIWAFGLKSIDLKFSWYQRDTGLQAFIISEGVKFVLE